MSHKSQRSHPTQITSTSPPPYPETTIFPIKPPATLNAISINGSPVAVGSPGPPPSSSRRRRGPSGSASVEVPFRGPSSAKGLKRANPRSNIHPKSRSARPWRCRTTCSRSSSAASRCVCKAWRDVIDARRLLRADLLPHSVRGIFLEYQLLDDQVFLAHPSMGPAIDGKLDFLLDPAQSGFATVLDQCNGLVLYRDHSGLLVLNPATQRWARLPPPPCTEFVLGLVVEFMLDRIARIVFDPAESPHYEIFLVPDNPDREEKVIRCRQAGNTSSVSIISGQTPLPQVISSTAEDIEEPDDSVPVDRLMEWPASTCIFRVFSSRTGRWGERVFAREGEAAGIADMTSQEYDSSWKGYAVYWRDVLFSMQRGRVYYENILVK